MMQFLSTNSAAISALATVVIAIFSVLMWWLSRRIHQASIQRDKEVNDLLIALSASILSAARPLAEAPVSGQIFEDHVKELRNRFKKIERE